MKRITVLYAAALIAAVITFSCSTGPTGQTGPVTGESGPSPEKTIQGIDLLIREISLRTVSLLSGGGSRTLAVYYFTVDGRESRISDYLINGLTTEVANLAGSEITIVSREGLDRVMGEQSLMVSELVSEDTRADIGELLGADVILTGYIVPFEDFDRINIQIVHVETGVVLGGFVLDYVLEPGFHRDSVDSTVAPGSRVLEIAGVSTIRYVHEDFESTVLNVSPASFEEYWGERVLSAYSATVVSEEGYGYLSFEAELDTADFLADWSESDLNFYLIYRNGWDITGRDGVAVKVYPESFTHLAVIVQQPAPGGDVNTWAAPVTLNPGEWSDLQIPFESFVNIDGTGGIDTGIPIDLGFSVSFNDNFQSRFFSKQTRLDGRLGIDDLGLFAYRESGTPGVIEAFEDRVTRAPGILRTGGALFYMDYSESDQGELKINYGVEAEDLRSVRVEDGPAGSYLSLSARLEVNESIEEFFGDEQDLYILYSLNSGIDWSDFNTLSFLIRSDVIRSCYIDITGNPPDLSYSGDFGVNSSWSQIRKPFSMLKTEGRTLEDLPIGPGGARINFIFPVPRRTIRQALETGVLEFTVDLDQIILQ